MSVYRTDRSSSEGARDEKHGFGFGIEHGFVLTVLCLILAFTGDAPAAKFFGAHGPSRQSAQARQESQSIKTRAGEVIVPVTVVDRNGDSVLNLQQEDFHIYDNGVERAIDHFDFGDSSLSIVLVVESSSHVEALLPAIHRTSVVFTEAVMTPSGEAAVIGFDNSVDLLREFTSDQESVRRSIEDVQPGTSGSKLYDAMSRGIALLEDQPAQRQRILVVTAEAQDRGSTAKLSDVLQHAKMANVVIHSIGLSTGSASVRAKPKAFLSPNIAPVGTFPSPTPHNFLSPQFAEGVQGNMDLGSVVDSLVRMGTKPNTLAVASQATGGLHVNTLRDRSIEQAMDQIGGELSTQYILSYSPSDAERSGYHVIRVEVSKPGVTVRTRPGYYMSPSQ